MLKDPKPTFYGLLYVDENQQGNTNIRGRGDQLDIYLRCAGLCARSIAYHGYNFQLVTNERLRIEHRMRRLGVAQLNVIEKNFALTIPKICNFGRLTLNSSFTSFSDPDALAFMWGSLISTA